ncbi:hypothetical protein [Jeotgalibacillus proteolyticus]|uniref:Uncharacterized protein n=1 Tax=Jeotgalibacillus proteolyticus TaxID=2082395 RepID=A0A2S5GG02_9BACL|nr:hypothetical protein [Jeotgalibacillus proteolyticus]PPA71888.1 hypothetical protein C4B60_00470 [Jeotgalibacillus proteolyticus]
MKLIRWTYAGRGRIRAYFDLFPASTVVLSKIRTFYFVRQVQWNERDPVVAKKHLQEMEYLINEELDTIEAYKKRRSST